MRMADGASRLATLHNWSSQTAHPKTGRPEAMKAALRRAGLALATGILLAGLFLSSKTARAQTGGAGQASIEPPNVVFILVDDLGWKDTGAYGNDFIETPNIDRLAGQGMRFTQAYTASPICTPTRASLQTGQAPARLDMNSIINPHRRPWAKLTPPENEWHLPTDRPTLAEALAEEADYTSTLIGKWNLGYKEVHGPFRNGYVRAPEPDTAALSDAYQSAVAQYKEANQYKGIGRQTTSAIRFLEEQQDAEDPFLLFFSPHMVHIALEARPELTQKYERKKESHDTLVHPEYAAMVETVDESVGLLARALSELGLTENTAVVFYSDNGGMIQVFHDAGPIVTNNAPLRGQKGNLYEGGIRVPLIVRWPGGGVEAGATSEVPVTSNDFFPTLMDWAGADAPEEGVDGTSIAPVLRGSGDSSLDREALYWHYPQYHHTAPQAAIRQGDYKLIEFYETGRLELYNLAEDLGERRNLAAEQPERAAALQEELHAWQESVDAGMPTPNPDYDPSLAPIWGKRPERPWQPSPKVEYFHEASIECIEGTCLGMD